MPNLPDPMTREQYYLKAIAENGGSGGGGGSGDLFIVNCSGPEGDRQVDKTLAEITEAFEAGRQVVLWSWSEDRNYCIVSYVNGVSNVSPVYVEFQSMVSIDSNSSGWFTSTTIFDDGVQEDSYLIQFIYMENAGN